MADKNGSVDMTLMAAAKAVIAVMLAGVVVYSIVAHVEIDAELVKVIVLLLAGYFGFSARMYYNHGRSGGK